MEVREYWNVFLTEKGHESALLRAGHATGFAGERWRALPTNVRRSLTRVLKAQATAKYIPLEHVEGAEHCPCAHCTRARIAG